MKTKEDFIYKYEDLIPDFYLQEMTEDLETVIQQSIADHEQLKWKKYPENKPKKDGYYIATYINGGCSECAYFINSPSFWDYNVIAFRELPTPYNEEGGEDATK